MKNSDKLFEDTGSDLQISRIYFLPLSTCEKTQLIKISEDIHGHVVLQLEDSLNGEGLELLNQARKMDIISLLRIQKDIFNLLHLDEVCSAN